MWTSGSFENVFHLVEEKKPPGARGLPKSLGVSEPSRAQDQEGWESGQFRGQLLLVSRSPRSSSFSLSPSLLSTQTRLIQDLMASVGDAWVGSAPSDRCAGASTGGTAGNWTASEWTVGGHCPCRGGVGPPGDDGSGADPVSPA